MLVLIMWGWSCARRLHTVTALLRPAARAAVDILELRHIS
jgi:hypothetical protein